MKDWRNALSHLGRRAHHAVAVVLTTTREPRDIGLVYHYTVCPVEADSMALPVGMTG